MMAPMMLATPCTAETMKFATSSITSAPVLRISVAMSAIACRASAPNDASAANGLAPAPRPPTSAEATPFAVPVDRLCARPMTPISWVDGESWGGTLWIAGFGVIAGGSDVA
ncbi:hypothetical protein DKM27_15875 [Mycobacterium tuberculosis variant bovis]|nr:hypothetical protein DKM27_15875 [Mycobacterium tuberculosis variant bovis]